MKGMPNMQNVFAAANQIFALIKERGVTEEAMSSVAAVMRSMAKGELGVLQELLEIGLCKRYMGRKLLKADRAGWNLVKHHKGQVLAMYGGAA